jgi:hypothetical protein
LKNGWGNSRDLAVFAAKPLFLLNFEAAQTPAIMRTENNGKIGTIKSGCFAPPIPGNP